MKRIISISTAMAMVLLCIMVIESYGAEDRELIQTLPANGDVIFLWPEETCLPGGWALRFTVAGATNEPTVIITKGEELVTAELELIYFKTRDRYSGWMYMPFTLDEVDEIQINGNVVFTK